MLTLAILFLALVAPSRQALQSPCPGVLEILPDSGETASPNARWYGKVTFPPGGHWLFMTIELDRKAYILGNWYGDVTTQDNKEYKIDNPNINHKREPVRFFVQYNSDDPPPMVKVIRLDGREICFDDGVQQSLVNPSPAPVSIPVPVVETHTTRSAAPLNRPPVTESSDFRVSISSFSPNEPVQCGAVKQNSLVALVVDGEPTMEGQWPWQVALYRTQFVNHNYICGGTLVSHRHVITAAHCTTVRGSKPPQKVLENTLTVYLGKHDLVTSMKGVQIRFVSKITIPLEYDTLSTYSRDISILELQDPVQYTKWVQPACLWRDDLADLNYVIGKKGSVVGWGNNGSGKLLLVEMPVVSQETCLRSKEGFYLSVTSDYTFCAGLKNGKSACNGDSGGGMVFKVGGFWHLRGVVSIAPAKENESNCDPMEYVVFTDVAKFLPWIRENIEPY